MPLRIIFMGTPDFSVPTLQALVDADHEIVAVYSQPPRPAGRRGLELKKSPVHQRADELGIPVFSPTSLKGEVEQNSFAKHNADVAIVVAYGMLLPRAILETPKLGCYNGHASLLPRWRGAAPIQRAIMAGDTQSGIMVMQMEAGLDTGPVAMTKVVPIDENMTAGDLHDLLSVVGSELMVEAMQLLENDKLPLVPQEERGVNYASKIEKAECRIDWSKPAAEVHNHIRGLSPFPGAWCEVELSGKPVRLKLLQSNLTIDEGEPGEVLGDGLTIACGSQAVKLVMVQKAGKQATSAEEFLRGNVVLAGNILE